MKLEQDYKNGRKEKVHEKKTQNTAPKACFVQTSKIKASRGCNYCLLISTRS